MWLTAKSQEKPLSLLDLPATAPADWSDADLDAFLRTAVKVTEQDRKENWGASHKVDVDAVRLERDGAQAEAPIIDEKALKRFEDGQGSLEVKG